MCPGTRPLEERQALEHRRRETHLVKSSLRDLLKRGQDLLRKCYSATRRMQFAGGLHSLFDTRDGQQRNRGCVRGS
jgi:hypothetical protein